MIFKQNFVKGRLNKDADIRLMPKGEYRDAFGVEVINSEGDDMGAIEVMLSNKKLTSYDVGENPLDMGNFSDEFRKKIFWLVLSDLGSFLFEWDDLNKVQSLVLGDTREEGSRVFSLHKDHLITGIVKVNTQQVKSDLLLFTDDNMQPICINIERAKTYGVNGFVEEDILLIKKPPRKAPKITPTYTLDGGNNNEERFFLFAYRFRYLDGEYSAPSDFSNYNFTPQPFDLDYFTLDNSGMINSFNAAKIEFNTGEKQVTEIQLLVKETLSNSLMIIETFSKSKNGWGDNQTKSFLFSNKKTIIPLPSDQLFRSFDNVPRLAKALSLLENIPVFSNYVEGYNIEDSEGVAINIDYTVSVKTRALESGNNLDISFAEIRKINITNPNEYLLEKGSIMVVSIETDINSVPGYNSTFFHTLESNYTNLVELFDSSSFGVFIDIINSDFQLNYNEQEGYSPPSNLVLQGPPRIFRGTVGGVASLFLNPLVFRDSSNNNRLINVALTFTERTNFTITNDINSGTAKTNRNYEVGKVYLDKYGRRSSVLTSKSNTIFIPQAFSSFQNKLVTTITGPAPYWADRYKLVVKSNPLAYQTLYVTEFYSEDFYTFCKLEGNNKDKVSVGDFLIIKKAGEIIMTDPIKIKVLEIEVKEEDFILYNQDEDENDIIERRGVYMKIMPKGFSMNRGDFDVRVSEAPEISSKDRFPLTYLELFSEVTPEASELAIPSGTSITLFFNSSRNYDDEFKNITYDTQFFAKRDYEDLEGWFKEVIFGRNSLLADDGSGEFDYDYLPNLNLLRVANSVDDGRLRLEVKGLLSGGTKNRKGRIQAKITVRIGSGVYVFETLPKQADSDIFFETEQCFDVVDGQHQGNVQSQDFSEGVDDAIVEMDFFNCYTQGNGIESFRIRDEFNTNYLSIDTRPSSTSVEEYREIRRFADNTYGKPYIESTNINGLNEFNLGNANFKEIDKQHGSIQRTLSREGNLLVLQEEKTGYVLFGKDLLSMANGQGVLATIPEILGKYIPYAGNNGIGKNPESLAVDGDRVNWVNARRGVPMRLSADGVTEINYGMSSHFRNLFIENPTSRKIGGYDAYFKKYVISIEDEIFKNLNAFCGNVIQKTITEAFTFVLNINFLLGETVLNTEVTNGEVDVSAVYDGVIYSDNGVTESSSLEIPRTDLTKNTIQVTITPVSDTATIQVTNICPFGIPMKVISIVLADQSDIRKTTINRYKWGAGSFFSEDHLFEDSIVSKFESLSGLEGDSRFPERGKSVNIQAYKDSSTTGMFYADRRNRLGYLISNAEYTEAQINDILGLATFPQTTKTQVSIKSFINQASFIFNRPNGNENLYLIWDYKDVFADTLTLIPSDKVNLPNNPSSSGANVTVKSSAPWSVVTTPPSWFTINGGSDTGDGQFTINANNNNTNSIRSFVLRVLTQSANPVSKEVTINQAASESGNSTLTLVEIERNQDTSDDGMEEQESFLYRVAVTPELSGDQSLSVIFDVLLDIFSNNFQNTNLFAMIKIIKNDAQIFSFRITNSQMNSSTLSSFFEDSTFSINAQDTITVEVFASAAVIGQTDREQAQSLAYIKIKSAVFTGVERVITNLPISQEARVNVSS
jgi:hypothetical protein